MDESEPAEHFQSYGSQLDENSSLKECSAAGGNFWEKSQNENRWIKLRKTVLFSGLFLTASTRLSLMTEIIVKKTRDTLSDNI